MRLSNNFNAARCLPAEAGSHTLTLGARFDSSTGDHIHICLRQPVTDGFVASWPGLR
jgi:hypothetical protein